MVNLTDLCREALHIIAEVDEPNTLIYDATQETHILPPVEMQFMRELGINWWNDVANQKGWKILQHITFKQFVLIDPDNIYRAQCFEADFKRLLEEIIYLSKKYLAQG
jgi:hypothetical protein